MTITDADRKAVAALREVLADISGFWHDPRDHGALCQAFAQIRLKAERAAPLVAADNSLVANHGRDFGRPMRSADRLRKVGPRWSGPAGDLQALTNRDISPVAQGDA